MCYYYNNATETIRKKFKNNGICPIPYNRKDKSMLSENEFEAKLYALSPENRKIILDRIDSFREPVSFRQSSSDSQAKEPNNEHIEAL